MRVRIIAALMLIVIALIPLICLLQCAFMAARFAPQQPAIGVAHWLCVMPGSARVTGAALSPPARPGLPTVFEVALIGAQEDYPVASVAIFAHALPELIASQIATVPPTPPPRCSYR